MEIGYRFPSTFGHTKWKLTEYLGVADVTQKYIYTPKKSGFLLLTLVSGGGQGGGANAGTNGGSAGTGSLVDSLLYPVFEGESIPIQVGGLNYAGVADTNGGAGHSTIFGSITLLGGGGGLSGTNGGTGGAAAATPTVSNTDGFVLGEFWGHVIGAAGVSASTATNTLKRGNTNNYAYKGINYGAGGAGGAAASGAGFNGIVGLVLVREFESLI